jgi:hypothetical protein
MELFSLTRLDTWLFMAAVAAGIIDVRVFVELRARMRKDHWRIWEKNGFTLNPSGLYRYFIFGENYRELDDAFIVQRVLFARLALAAFLLLIAAQVIHRIVVWNA